MIKKTILLIFLTAALCSCVASKGQQGAIGGAAAGALIGQAIGHNTSGTLIGAAVGTMLGYVIGNEMDKNDRAIMSDVYETVPNNQVTEWKNPDTGNQYSVTPRRTFKNPRSGRDCREAEILSVIDGKAEKTIATACREDGNWVIQ